MIRKAVFLLGDEGRQVVEGAGTVSVASIMENRGLFMGKEVVAVMSGGKYRRQAVPKHTGFRNY